MTETELVQVIDRLSGLWPKMSMTIALTEAWRVMLRPFQFDAAMAALIAHWNDAGDKWTPDQKQVRILTREHTTEYRSESEQATAERFHAMTDIDQARAQRDWFRFLAAKEQDSFKKSKYENIVYCVQNKIVRLFKIGQERKPNRITTVEELEHVVKCRIKRGDGPE